MTRINVNVENSKMIAGKLFITGMKMAKLAPKLAECIVGGSTVQHPVLGTLYEYNGPYSRA